jgi:hypothetical protein
VSYHHKKQTNLRLWCWQLLPSAASSASPAAESVFIIRQQLFQVDLLEAYSDGTLCESNILSISLVNNLYM